MPIEIKATQHLRRGDTAQGAVVASGTAVPKRRELRFQIIAPENLRYPCTVKFKVENHGNEARVYGQHPGRKSYGNHESPDHEINNANELATLEHWEPTLFRGLHYLIAEIRNRTGSVPPGLVRCVHRVGGFHTPELVRGGTALAGTCSLSHGRASALDRLRERLRAASDISLGPAAWLLIAVLQLGGRQA
jgi:hypothetical protein